MQFRARALKVMLLLLAGLLVVAGYAVASTGESTSPATSTSQPASTPQPRAGMMCMPRPSACGFPDATNTGVTPGAQLTPANGVVTLSSPGQVYENKQLTGSLLVTAPNVTIRNVRLINTDSYYAIGVKNGNSWESNNANLLLDHVEINLNGHPDVKGIAFNGFTARNVLFHNGADCSHFGVNVVIQDSLCALGPDANGDGSPDGNSFCNGPDHFDGFQSDGGRNITLRHNTIRNPCEQTSAILMSTNTSRIDSVVVDHNLMSGGGYTVYCGTDSGGITTNMTYTNNVISREFFPRGGYWGPTTECDKVDVSGGNVWDGNYVPPAGGGAGGTAGGGPAGGGPGAGTQGAISYLLSKARARKLTRTALARELKRRFTRRAKGMRIRCRRRSRSTVACTVRWKARTGRRYKGTVRVTRVAANTFRYSLRIKSRSKLVKRTGRVTPSRPGA